MTVLGYPNALIGINEQRQTQSSRDFVRLRSFEAGKSIRPAVCVSYAFLAFSTIALKASGLCMARSASTLRLISIPALCSKPISLE